MANLQLRASGKIRVQFRKKGLKLITRTFENKAEAIEYDKRLETDFKKIHEAERSALPVDKIALFNSLHPDLKPVVISLPIFASLVGEINGGAMTLNHLIDKFITEYTKKDTNIFSRLKWWGNHFGNIPVKSFIEDHVRQGMQKLLIEGSVGKRGCSPQTTNRFKANLSSVFEFGKEYLHLKNNPCQQVKTKPEGKGRKRYLAEDEQQRFLAAAKQSRWDKFYLLVLMAITTGARRAELVSKLRWNDIDWENARAFCRDTKNGADKILILMPLVMNELKRFRQVGNGLIFCNPRNPAKAYYDFRKDWDAAIHLAGIPVTDEKGEKIVFHSLRHTFCSTLANRGGELHEIAKLAGHRNLQTTLRYVHSNNERLSTVVNNTFDKLV